MDEYEAKAHGTFKTRTSIVYGHDQRDPATAVRLFDENDSRGIIPHSVMWDSGAEVGVCISMSIANRLGLTWSPGLQLIGVGGLGGAKGQADQEIIIRLGGDLGGAKGQADQEIIIRLGGDGTPNDTWSTELNGVFAIKVRPIIMTDEMTDNISHNVLIGTQVMWRALARFDPLTETMEVAPAFLRHGITGFRVTLPCHMSKPRNGFLAASIMFRMPEPPQESFLPALKPTIIQPIPGAVPKPSSPKTVEPPSNPKSIPTIPPKPRFTTFRDLAHWLVNAHQAVGKAMGRLPSLPSSKSSSHGSSHGSDSGSKPNSTTTPIAPVVAPLHPGHPQKSNIATKEEYRVKRNETAARNSANRAEAQNIQREALRDVGSYRDALAQPRVPTLKEEFILKTAKLKAIITAQGARITSLEGTIGLLKKAIIPSRSAPLETTQRAVKEITPPLNAPVPADSAPAQPAAAPVPAPAQPSGGASSSSSPTPSSPPASTTQAPPNAKGKQPKVAKPKAPSTHRMQTRTRVVQQGGLTVVSTIRPDETPHEALRVEDDMPLKDARAWVLVTRKKKRPQRPSAPSAQASAAAALAATATALAALPSTSALQVMNQSSSSSHDQSTMWVQLVAAAALWAAYTTAKHLARRSRKLTYVVNWSTLALAICFIHQSIGIWHPIAQHWQELAAIGAAAPVSLVILVAYVVHWHRAERRLLRQAVSL